MVSWNSRLRPMSLGSRRVHRGGGEGRGYACRGGKGRGGESVQQRRARRALYSRLGLIQVQRRCRRLYDDEEHLGDRRACNFLVAQTSHLYTDLYSSPRVQHVDTHTHTHIAYSRTNLRTQTRREDRVHRVYSDTTSHGCMGPICI